MCYCSALAFKIASSRPKSDDFLYFFDTICASLKKQTNKQTNKQTKILNKTEELINFQLLVISLSQNRCIHKVSDVLVSHQKKLWIFPLANCEQKNCETVSIKTERPWHLILSFFSLFCCSEIESTLTQCSADFFLYSILPKTQGVEIVLSE